MRDEIEAFFRSYRDAYNRFDVAAVAGHIAAPSILAAREVTLWSTRKEVAEAMATLVAHYRANGFVRADFDLDRLLEQGRDDAVVDVEWTIDRGPEPAWRFRTGYNLRRFSAGWRIVFCTAYEEQGVRLKS